MVLQFAAIGGGGGGGEVGDDWLLLGRRDNGHCSKTALYHAYVGYFSFRY